MALMQCKDCKKEYSTTAKCCPNCGAIISVWSKKIDWKIPVVIIGFFIYSVASMFSEESHRNNYQNTSSVNTNKVKYLNIHEILHTRYFEVTVNKIDIYDKVLTGNKFADLKPESGIRYLVLNVTYKNTDIESRRILEGSIYIVDDNNKKYKFDKSEHVMSDGWGLTLERINPLVSKTANLVYKIPATIKGSVYYNPGRSDDTQLIFLGNLRD